MKSSNIKLEINWLYVSFIIIIAFISLGFIAWIITNQNLENINSGNQLSYGWNKYLIILVYLFCILGLCSVFWLVYKNYKTIINSEFISIPTLFGVRKIYWREVQQINIFAGAGVHISNLNYKIVLTPYAFKNSSELIEYVFKKCQEATNLNA